MSVPATQHMPEQGAGNRRILVILAVVVAAMVGVGGWGVRDQGDGGYGWVKQTPSTSRGTRAGCPPCASPAPGARPPLLRIRTLHPRHRRRLRPANVGRDRPKPLLRVSG